MSTSQLSVWIFEISKAAGIEVIMGKDGKDKGPKTDQTGIYLFFARKEKVEMI
jgi:hypothetical protein